MNESDDRQQFYIRLYSACVGLCPDIMPETLLAATPPNVRISGGRCLVRLLLHDQEVIRRSVRSALSNTVERYPIERAQVFEGLATLMVTEMKALTTLRLTVLLEFATQLMDRIPQFFSQDVPQPDPSSWQSRFDAVAVMALTRHDVRLRTAARNILQRSASPTLRNLLHEFNLDGDRYQGVARFATLCCEDLELYDGMIVHLRRLLSVMLSAGRAEPWIEACRPNLGYGRLVCYTVYQSIGSLASLLKGFAVSYCRWRSCSSCSWNSSQQQSWPERSPARIAYLCC